VGFCHDLLSRSPAQNPRSKKRLQFLLSVEIMRDSPWTAKSV
jgi:hypothetical protein